MRPRLPRSCCLTCRLNLLIAVQSSKESMMQNVTKLYYPVGRAFLGALFLISGVGKIFSFSYVAGWMASSGLPAASLLLAVTIVIEVGGGLSLITGYKARLAALVIALFL